MKELLDNIKIHKACSAISGVDYVYKFTRKKDNEIFITDEKTKPREVYKFLGVENDKEQNLPSEQDTLHTSDRETEPREEESGL